jgi:AraC family transcriptional regulator, alkane utilization regulator
MDVLTQVLDTLRFRSTLYCRVEISAPWGLRFAPTSVASFHVIERGDCWLKVEGSEDALPLTGGDLIVLTQGAGHFVGDRPGTPPITCIRLDEEIPASPELRRYVHSGATTTMLCGLFELEQPLGSPLLALLPPLIHLPGANGRSEPWLEATLAFLANEVGASRLGSDTLVRRLTDMLFIQVLRAWAEGGTTRPHGWLAALRDPQIGAALALMHAQPERSWTVEGLAEAVSMSRSAFSARFSQLVEEPPLRYLRRWRMQKAGDLLRRSDAGMAAIAAQVGYSSTVAFSQVFKREVGSAPHVYRRAAQRGERAPGLIQQGENVNVG